MTLGTLGYLAIYFVLFWVCLRSVGLVIGARHAARARSRWAGC